MSINRDRLREEAKRVYKDQVKGVPKKQRMPFAEFYKKYKLAKTIQPKQKEDFDFDDMVSINDLEDDVELETNDLDE